MTRQEARAAGATRYTDKPCRVCGAKGAHEPSNFALLPAPLNASKGNRCMSCYMLDMGSPVVVWLPDQA